MNYEPTYERPYRARDGAIFGVCKGLARYAGFSVFWTRVVAVLLLFFGGIWPVLGIYLLAALLMKPEPVLPPRSAEEQEFYTSYVTSRKMALQRLKRTFDQLDRRIQRLENIVTAPGYNWEERLRQ